MNTNATSSQSRRESKHKRREWQIQINEKAVYFFTCKTVCCKWRGKSISTNTPALADHNFHSNSR